MALVSRNVAVDTVQVLSSRPDLSRFELFLTCSPPILESFLLQAPTSTILALYQTSSYLRQFIRTYPTSWKYLSFRLQQPQQTTAATAQNNATGVRQSSNYALDQLLIYIVNPFSTCLTSLELDNTAVSGQILTQTVLHLRRDTLIHLSVRGCKNVSLKYHINPWLTLYALTSDLANASYAPKEFQQLALKSLYVYRCRHHRRRPYLPQSLVRKDSDSEPTHELVNICHKLGIWTDTAWCTTPGPRCDRRKGYVSQRVPPDPREVWVVYDRLWRSKNWLGPVEGPGVPAQSDAKTRKRKRDGRSWEYGEDAAYGEPLGTRDQGKALPAHLRLSHRQFVENVVCDNCSAVILERCEQCSVRMHCSGCRKTLCASCAFDRPYLRNKNASDEAKNAIWWAPGCAVSPCSMQDHDSVPIGPGMNPPPTTNNASNTPNLKLKWCCTEPSFSGGGGITFFGGSHPDNEQIKASPLPRHKGWEDLEFDRDIEMEVDAQIHNSSSGADTIEASNPSSTTLGLAGRFVSIDDMFSACPVLQGNSSQAPRNLCDECYSLETWKVTCKACSLTICLKHDVREKMRVRICGYRDLAVEKMDFRARQKLSKSKALASQSNKRSATSKPILAAAMAASTSAPQTPARQNSALDGLAASGSVSFDITPSSTRTIRTLISDDSTPLRSASPGSNSTGPPSRASSPSPSDDALSTASEERNLSRRPRHPQKATPPDWRGCQGFLCPPTRPPGDNRRRCLAVTRQCNQCKVHVCDTCLVDVSPSCPCKGCRTTTTPTPSMSSLVGEPRFFCPNCRYDRMVSGDCKRRMPVEHLEGRKRKRDGRERVRKPLATRMTHIHPGQNFNGTNFSNINDEAMEQVSEFMEWVQLSDTTGPATTGQAVPITSIPTQPTILALGQPQIEDEDDIQELTDMGEMARDLVRRIQRLRGQMRPGSAARSALPDLRMEGDEDEAAAARLQLDIPAVEELILPAKVEYLSRHYQTSPKNSLTVLDALSAHDVYSLHACYPTAQQSSPIEASEVAGCPLDISLDKVSFQVSRDVKFVSLCMNEIHLARVLGTLSHPGFQRIQSNWLINSIQPQLHATFNGTAPKEGSSASQGKVSTEVEQPVAHAAGTSCLTIDTADGRYLVSGGADASIRLWDLEAPADGQAHRPAASLLRSSRGAHTHGITAVLFYPFDPVPSTLITASHEKSVKLISVTASSLESVHNFPLDHAPYTVALSHLPSAQPLVAVGTAHPATRLLDLRSGLGTHSLPGHNGSVYSICWSPKYDYVLASGAADGRVLFFDIRRANAAFGSLDLDDTVGIVGDDIHSGAGARKALDWNARAHAGPVTGVQWTTDGDKIVTAGHDQRIRVFDAATGRNDLVHFGPRIRNDRAGPHSPLLSPPGYTRPGKELLYWPNDDGKGDIYIHSLREGSLLGVLSTPGVQRNNTQQGKGDSIGKLTSGGRINAMVWRVNAASGQSIELYSAHGNGKILEWCPKDDDVHLSQQDLNNNEAQQQEQARKRKRELVGNLVEGLSNKSMRV